MLNSLGLRKFLLLFQGERKPELVRNLIEGDKKFEDLTKVGIYILDFSYIFSPSDLMSRFV